MVIRSVYTPQSLIWNLALISAGKPSLTASEAGEALQSRWVHFFLEAASQASQAQEKTKKSSRKAQEKSQKSMKKILEKSVSWGRQALESYTVNILPKEYETEKQCGNIEDWFV